MKNRSLLFNFQLIILALVLLMCTPAEQAEKEQSGNPPMQDFDAAGSDPKAIEIADEVMTAQGGRENWDATRYLAWNFFGVRKLLWDKYTGNVRVENIKDNTKILVNINNGKGQVFRDGAPVTQPDSLAKYLKQGKEAWINDSYWLVMPFKLKDSGVTLKYLGQDTTQAGQPADVLQLTYKNVGVTPNNRYQVYVDKQTRLVSQWAYYENATDEKPKFIMPWQDYKTYGTIKLSGDRGQAQLTEIQVPATLPTDAFTSFSPVNIGR